MGEIEVSPDLNVWYSNQNAKELLPADLVKALFLTEKPENYKLKY